MVESMHTIKMIYIMVNFINVQEARYHIHIQRIFTREKIHKKILSEEKYNYIVPIMRTSWKYNLYSPVYFYVLHPP